MANQEYLTPVLVEQWVTVLAAGIRGNRYITRMGLSSANAIADSVKRNVIPA
jgi:hypothetical protein